MAATALSAAVVPGSRSLRPNLEGQLAQPLRYTPEGHDFVITNGEEFFNRPLYGGNTGFRVDAGDRPEFVLYLPGRGGNLRLALRQGNKAAWLHELATIEARYRPGSMVYEIRDPHWLGPKGRLELTAVAARDFEGLLLQVAVHDVPASLELAWAYGGVNGQRGVRDGDIGTEKVPISQWFQLQPEFAAGNRYSLDEAAFMLEAKPGALAGAFPAGAQLHLAPAEAWNDLGALLQERQVTPDRPVLMGQVRLLAGQPFYLGLQRLPSKGEAPGELQDYLDVRTPSADDAVQESPADFRVTPGNLAAAFARAERQRAELASQIRIETPDPYLNAAVAALNVAADAVWDEPQGAVMHGAIAWRSKLLGWRGPYAMDALGWHDRARRHLAYWPTRQNLEPIPDQLAPPEEATNLARSRTALHSQGNMANSHYDMNLVYIDALFRHLMWTGDLEFAEEVWPTVERHLAWERRMFRREYGPDKLPLYEAYAAIWASDDLQYHGGGVAYTSAYNYWHNIMAARVAEKLGRDATPYAQEAELIARAMREVLWMPELGMFAEYKDLLGRQLLHREPGLWSFYHLMDAELPTDEEALAMTRWIDAHIPHLPVYGPGVPDEPLHVLSSTSWMPYTWSVNNVVMGENVHTALGYWQAGRAEEAYRITRSAILASMFMGICPGNVGSMNYLDVYRRESQRDFADGSGVLSRTLVEGLFGLQPDLLGGKLNFAPGLPLRWDHATLDHPSVAVDFQRKDGTDRYTVTSRLAQPTTLHGKIVARSTEAQVRVNGRKVASKVEGELPISRLTFEAPAADRWEIEIEWRASAIAPIEVAHAWPLDDSPEVPGVSGIDWREPLPRGRQLEPVKLTPSFNDSVTGIFAPGKYRSPRSPYVSLAIPAQGIGAWAGHVNAMAEIDDSGLRALGGRLEMPNGVWFSTPAAPEAQNIAFASQWDNYPNELTVPLEGRAHRIHLLMAGSTNHMQSRLENGTVVVRYTDGSEARLPLVNPSNWWPIEQDYFIDDYQFRRPGPLPPRVDLKTGQVRLLEPESFKGQGGDVPGGAATVLTLPLDPAKELRELYLVSHANEVVIGLMAATLERP
ncbi:MAG: DUF4450 domain-containing protein [Verrucomicrobiota bacterium JB022]|nr:DUF4450 domain-containing protein [Verrucomicrobiota bacterium JB022]